MNSGYAQQVIWRISHMSSYPVHNSGKNAGEFGWFVVFGEHQNFPCLKLNFNYLVSVTAGGPVIPRGHMLPSSTVDFGWFVAFGEHQNFPCLKLIEIVIFGVYYTIPFGFNLFWHLLVISIQIFKLHCLVKDHWRGFSTRNAHMVHIDNLIRLKMVYTS